MVKGKTIRHDGFLSQEFCGVVGKVVICVLERIVVPSIAIHVVGIYTRMIEFTSKVFRRRLMGVRIMVRCHCNDTHRQ